MQQGTMAPSRGESVITSLDALYDRATDLRLTPGWIDRQEPIMGSRPRSRFRPQIWRYADAHQALEAAGSLIDVELAERRNLVMRNDIPDNDWATSRTLVCAYQMILPGETAPSHRHTSNALRAIIDGIGTYSVVDGEKMPMETGDVVLTPGGHYHGHGHDGDEPAYWLDCLDVPLTYLLEPMYFEGHPQRYETISNNVSQSPYRFSRDWIGRGLDDAKPDSDQRYGARIKLPTPSMPATGLSVERIESGLALRAKRCAANRIFMVIEGMGTSIIEGETFHWRKGDTFLAPAENWLEHGSQSDAVLLEMSDEPLMRFSNHYREEYR